MGVADQSKHLRFYFKGNEKPLKDLKWGREGLNLDSKKILLAILWPLVLVCSG